MGAQIQYILSDIILLNYEGVKPAFTISNNDDGYMVYFSSHEYRERLFDFNCPSLDESDLSALDSIRDLAMRDKRTALPTLYATIEGELASFPFLKIFHFFANEFYLVPGYKPDVHGRTPTTAVDARYLPYLEFPLLDILKYCFLKYNTIENDRSLQLIFSCDFDILNMWTHLGLVGSIKRFVRSVVYFKARQFFVELPSFLLSRETSRFNYLLNEESFWFNNGERQNIAVRNIGFWLVGASNKRYDAENNFSEEPIAAFIAQLTDHGVELAMHPSYDTHDSNVAFLNNQVTTFIDIFKIAPILSRFHYLRCQFPHDLLLLEAVNIREDHTYSFPDSILFRGARACPVKLWSFTLERPIEVVSYPLSLMDGTLTDYMHLAYNTALQLCETKIDLSFEYGEVTSLLWHNRSLYRYGIPRNYHPKLYRGIKKHIAERLESFSTTSRG